MNEVDNGEINKQGQEPEDKEQKVFCAMCGAELEPGQLFCGKCGHKRGDKIAPKKKGVAVNKAVIAAGALILGVVLFLFIRGTQAKEVLLDTDRITIRAGESAKLSYTINPENTKNKKITWLSSNDAISSVEDGKVKGLKEGSCTITAETANGKTDTCVITVEPAGPNLTAIYNKHCEVEWASITSDGSCLTIDTNPSDKEDASDISAMLAVYEVNKALGLAQSVDEKMGNTRSIDGMQSAMGDGIEVSWTYHPNNGLEVIYSLTNK